MAQTTVTQVEMTQATAASLADTWNELFLDLWANSDELAVIDDDIQWNGKDLLAHAAGASLLYDGLDLVEGSVVPMLMDETPTSIAMVVGGALSNRPAAPLGTKLSAEELVDMVKALGTPVLFASPERAELAREVARLSAVELHIIDRIPEPLAKMPAEFGQDARGNTVVVVHTSGTTGRAKAVHMSQEAMCARIDVYQRVLGLDFGDRYCSASPFYHTAGVGMVFTVLGMGAGLIPQDWFSIEGWRRAGRLGITCALLVPTMLDILLAEGALADASPRVLQYGAAPIHPDTLTQAIRTLPDTRFLQIFGQTEVSPISFLTHEDHLLALESQPELLTSVGRPIFNAELVIENPDDDGIGEVAIKGPHVFVADDDGWRRTGDFGVFTAEGVLSLQGRLNDRIIRGGENVYPNEVEKVLRDHPQVTEVAIIGVPDRRWGEVIKAVVVIEDGASVTSEELVEFASAHLAHFKVPTVFEFMDELPRNPGGKVLRRQLR